MEDNNIKNKSTNNPDYHKVTTKLFYNSLLNIPLFAAPAFSAVFLGKYLDARFETGKTITIILLFIAFSLSWFFVLKKNSKLTREYRSVREEMKKSEGNNEAKN